MLARFGASIQTAYAQGLSHAQNFEGTANGSLLEAIRNIVNSLLALAALVAAIMLIVGIYTALGAGTDDDIAARARGNIVYISIGIIVILLSAVLVSFIISSIN